MENDNIPLNPVTGFSSAPIAAFGAVMLQIQYVDNPAQPVGQAHQSPNYVLTAAQARELVQQIVRTLGVLESVTAPQGGKPQH